MLASAIPDSSSIHVSEPLQSEAPGYASVQKSKPVSVSVARLTCLALKLANCTDYSTKSQANGFQLDFQLLNVDGKWRVVEMTMGGIPIQRTHLSTIASIRDACNLEAARAQ